MKIVFGVWKVNLWMAFDGVFQGEAILTTSPKGMDVPPIMREGIPFLVTPEGGLMGENVKYIFPPLIPRILATVKAVKATSTSKTVKKN